MKTTLYVSIEIEHDEDLDPSDALDHVLDNGDLQDALNSYAEDCLDGDFEVIGAYEVALADITDTDTESHRGHKGICGTVPCRAMEDI